MSEELHHKISTLFDPMLKEYTDKIITQIEVNTQEMLIQIEELKMKVRILESTINSISKVKQEQIMP